MKTVVIGNGPGALALASKNSGKAHKQRTSLLETKSGKIASDALVQWPDDSEIFMKNIEKSLNPSEVIPEADVILICNPYNTHLDILKSIAPYITKKLKLICATPGAYGFDWIVRKVFSGLEKNFSIGALESLPYIAKYENRRLVKVRAIKSNLHFVGNDLSALRWVPFLQDFFGVKLTILENFLAMNFLNPGAQINPLLFLEALNHQDSSYKQRNIYELSEDNENRLNNIEHETRKVALSISAKTGLNFGKIPSLKEWFIDCYPNHIIDKSTVKSCMYSHTEYAQMSENFAKGVGAGTDTKKSRYLTEQIPFGLLSIKGLAVLAGEETQAIDEVIEICQPYIGKTYVQNGKLTIDSLECTSTPQAFGIDVLSKLSRLYSPHTKGFSLEKEEFKENGVAFLGKILPDDAQYKKINKVVSKALTTVSKNDSNQSLLNLHWTDPAFAEICAQPEFIDVACKLLECEEVRVFSSIIVVKHPHGKMVVPWHQDAAFQWPIDPLDCTCLWLALDDTDMENGAMSFAIGAHKSILPMIKTPPVKKGEFFFSQQLQQSIDSQYIDKFKKIDCEMAKYECSFHHSLIPHQSPINNTNRRRCAFVVRYCRGDAKLNLYPGMPREDFFGNYKLFNPMNKIVA